MLLDHFLNLFLLGVTVAGEGFFDLVRCVFVDHEIILPGDEEDDTTSFGNRDAGGDVLGEEEFLDGEAVGVVGVDDLVERIVNIKKTVAERGVRWSGNNTTIEHLRVTTIESIHGGALLLAIGVNICRDFYNSKTTDTCAWVNTENTHYLT